MRPNKCARSAMSKPPYTVDLPAGKDAQLSEDKRSPSGDETAEASSHVSRSTTASILRFWRKKPAASTPEPGADLLAPPAKSSLQYRASISVPGSASGLCVHPVTGTFARLTNPRGGREEPHAQHIEEAYIAARARDAEPGGQRLARHQSDQGAQLACRRACCL